MRTRSYTTVGTFHAAKPGDTDVRFTSPYYLRPLELSFSSRRNGTAWHAHLTVVGIHIGTRSLLFGELPLHHSIRLQDLPGAVCSTPAVPCSVMIRNAGKTTIHLAARLFGVEAFHEHSSWP